MGTASTLADVHDKKGLKWFTWAIYDGMLLPGDLLELQGQHDWVEIIAGTYCLMYRGNRDSEHCPPCTSTSFDVTQAARRATLQHGPAPPSRAMPPPRTPRTPYLRSTVNVPPRAASSYSAEGPWLLPWTTAVMRRRMDLSISATPAEGLRLPPWTTVAMRRRRIDPSISSMATEFSLGVPKKQQKCPLIRWCIALPPRMVKFTPCGEPPSG